MLNLCLQLTGDRAPAAGSAASCGEAAAPRCPSIQAGEHAVEGAVDVRAGRCPSQPSDGGLEHRSAALDLGDVQAGILAPCALPARTSPWFSG